MRRVLVTVAISLFAGPLNGQTIGALVGLQTTEELRSIWIPLGSGAGRPVQLPELIVPVGNQFWRIGARERCEVADMTDHRDDGTVRIMVAWDTIMDQWVTPIDSHPNVPAGISCEEAKHEAEELRGKYRQEAEAQGVRYEPGLFDRDSCSWTGTPLVFVNSKLISEIDQGNFECGVHPDAVFTWETLRWPSLKRFDLSQWYPGDLANLFSSEFAKQFQPEQGEPVPELTRSDDDTLDQFSIHTDRWLAYHSEGRVRFRAMIKTHRLRGYFTDFDLPIQPPRELFGKDYSSKIWPSVKGLVPHAHDVFVAPRGKLVLVLTGESRSGSETDYEVDKLIFFRLNGERIGRELFRMPVSDHTNVVMVEWAVGHNAQRWDSLLRGWAKKGLPQAIFVTQGEAPKN